MALDEAGLQLIAAGVAAYIGDLNKADRATTGFYGTLGSADKSAGAFQQVITGALRQVGAALVDFAVQGVKAIGGFVKDSVGLAGDFESGMLTFQSVAGKDVDASGLEEFRDLFIQIGKELPVSTAEVQLAATEMVKGGIDPATVAAGGLRQNIQFAAAAMDGDLVKAAEISSKVMGGWTSLTDSAADKSAFLTHATDLLAKAANASSTDVEGLSLGIFNAQGIAKTAGVSFDDLTTTLAELAPRFASSSEAGTSLKNLISRLQPTTKPAIAAMEGLGLVTEDGKNKFYDANGAFIGFQKASQLLQDSLQGLTKQQQAQILQTIFGNDAMSAASALAELGADGYQSMADALANANGVQEAAALKQQGFNTALDNAKGSVEALQITIGSALLPVITELLNDVIAPAVNTFTDMADAVFGNDEAFSRLSPTAQAIVSVIDVLIADVQEIVGAFDDAGAMSSEFGESIGLLASDLGLPGELIQDIVFAVQDLVKWFGAASDEGDALGGVVDDMSSIWAKAGVVIADVMAGYQSIAQAVLPIVTQFIDDHGQEISAFFQTAYDKIINIVNLALDLYDAVVPKALGSVAGFIDDHAAAIQTILGGAWDVISGLIDGALTLIEGIIKVALDLIHGDWEKAWTDIQEMSAQVVLDLGQVIEGFLNIIAGFFDTSLSGIVQTWKDNWAMLVDIALETDWMQVGQNVVDGIKQGLINSWDSLTHWLSDKAKSMVNAALDAIGAHSPADAFMPVGQFAVEGIIQGFKDAWPSLEAFVGSFGDDLASKAQDIAEQVQSAVASGLTSGANIDRQKIKNLDSLEGLSEKGKAAATLQFDQAAQAAAQITDPKQAAEFFKLRSEQIIELGKLTDQIAETTDRDERARLIARYNLINDAQNKELAAQRAQQAAQETPLQNIANQINDIMKALAGINLTDDQIRMADGLSGLIALLGGLPPGRASGGPVNAGTPYVVGEQGPELFIPRAAGDIMSALASRQSGLLSPASMMSGATNNHTQSTTLNMPIYTNQSPQVMQQSMAIAMAGLV